MSYILKEVTNYGTELQFLKEFITAITAVLRHRIMGHRHGTSKTRMGKQNCPLCCSKDQGAVS